MNSSVTASPVHSRSWPARIAWAALIVLGVYYILEAVPAYLTFNEERVGPYFWPRVNTVFVHAIGGSLALILGFFQFWPWLRNTHRKVHRVMGRTYLAAIGVGAISGYMLAFTSSVHVAYAGGLTGLATAWVLTGGMALVSIRNRNIEQHKQWMVRSYVVTFAFVFFRISSDFIQSRELMASPDHLIFLSWACWAFPLMFAEAVIQWKQATAKRASRGQVQH
ncbi:MAG: DUF2306 domain-containing protein [Xanthomonadales bacterium]|nr:DUF2306 domain-containing protein [Xanthomonadales bacterium]